MAGDRRATLVVGAALAAIGGADPGHRALVVTGDRITWTGADPAAAPRHDAVLDLGEGWLTPGFVDAHVHATATGLQAAGIDLTGADGPDAVAAAIEASLTRPRQPWLAHVDRRLACLSWNATWARMQVSINDAARDARPPTAPVGKISHV